MVNHYINSYYCITNDEKMQNPLVADIDRSKLIFYYILGVKFLHLNIQLKPTFRVMPLIPETPTMVLPVFTARQSQPRVTDSCVLIITDTLRNL